MSELAGRLAFQERKAAVQSAREARDWDRVARLLTPVFDDIEGDWPFAAHVFLADALRRLDRNDAAMAAYTAIWTLWPEKPAGWQGKAEIAAQIKDWSTAESAWAVCLERFPQQQKPAWWIGLATTQREQGKAEEAGATYALIRERWPDDPAGWRADALDAGRSGDWARAERLWQEVITRFPDQQSVQWWLHRAIALRHSQRFDEASWVYAEVRRFWPDDPAGWHAEAQALAARGLWSRSARRWLECIARFDLRARPVLLQNCAQSLIQAGRFREAEQQIGALRELSPPIPAWMAMRLDLRRAQGDPRRALREIQLVFDDPLFDKAFTPSTLIEVAYDAGLTQAETLAFFKGRIGAGLAEAEIARHFHRKAPSADALPDDADGTQKALRAAPQELRRLLRAFARQRTYGRYKGLALFALVHSPRTEIEKILAIGALRFPHSRLRVIGAATLRGTTISAHEAEQEFAYRWRNLLPSANMSIANQLSGRPRRRLVCALIVRDEEELLSHFMSHYLRLGVDSFIIINNGSQTHPSEHLTAFADCEITYVEAPFSFLQAYHGMSWINEIIQAELCDWLLFIDCDEMLVYPGNDKYLLPDLLDHFDRRGETAMRALMIDLYDDTFLETGRPSQHIGEQRLFFAAHRRTGGLRPQWRAGLRGMAYPGGASKNVDKVPLIKVSEKIFYTNNHETTTCRYASISGVLQHLKLFRDRHFFHMPAASIAQHPRVKDRGKYCVARHLRMAASKVDASLEQPFHVVIADKRLRRLGYYQADTDWEKALSTPTLSGRGFVAVAPGDALPTEAEGCTDNFSMLDEPLQRVLAELRSLGAGGHREQLRRLVSVQTARLGSRGVRLAVLLFVANALGREAASKRILSTLLRALKERESRTSIRALCEVADAFVENAALARILTDELDRLHPGNEHVTQSRLTISIKSGDRKKAHSALATLASKTTNRTMRQHLVFLAGVQDWDTYCDRINEILENGDILQSRFIMTRIVQIPNEANRNVFLRKLLDKIRASAAPHGPAVLLTQLSLLHLLKLRPAFDELYNESCTTLPSTARIYFSRLVSQRKGVQPSNRIWCLGLSKTGTTSFHDYCSRIDMLSAHWVNPILGSLIDREDADAYDVVSDTPVVYLARTLGVPKGRKVVATHRAFSPWAASFSKHYAKAFFSERLLSFEELRERVYAGNFFRFGSLWHNIQKELYFRFESLRHAYDFQMDWIGAMQSADVPILYLPLEMTNLEKISKLKGFLEPDVANVTYPHSNRATYREQEQAL